jgi:pimeloyl-ACP methyl ester carboxylesterase
VAADLRLHLHEWGEGPRVVLVHGIILGGRYAWIEQQPLSERWRLVAPDRPGHGDTPADGRQDFERDAALVADQLLGEPSHLLGLSYGAIVAALAAARRPDGVRSLTLVEPPAWGLVPDDPEVVAYGSRRPMPDDGDAADPRQILETVFDYLGIDLPLADPLPEPLEQGARALVGLRHPGEAEMPIEDLAAAPFPKLVVSGGHNAAFEAVADRLAAGVDAERAVIPGAGHLVPSTGAPFNARLEAFLHSV